MLPMFPVTQKRSHEAFMGLFYAARNNVASLLQEMRTTHQMDGDKAFYERSSGERVEMEYQEIKISWELPIKNGIGLSPQEFMERAHKSGEDMGTQEMEYFLRMMNDVTESVGNVVNVGGAEFSFEHYVEMLEKTDADFLDTGVPSPRTILASPSASAQMQKSLEEWEQDENKRAILKEIYDRKRHNHNEREAHRRVVD